jgi:hypothetical protein
MQASLCGREGTRCPEVDQHDFTLTNILGQLVHVAFHIGHLEVCEFLAYGNLA